MTSSRMQEGRPRTSGPVPGPELKFDCGVIQKSIEDGRFGLVTPPQRSARKHNPPEVAIGVGLADVGLEHMAFLPSVFETR
jgi:hypothetical protein